MSEDLGDEGIAEGVDTIARHTFIKERQPYRCQNHRTISLISQSIKIML